MDQVQNIFNFSRTLKYQIAGRNIFVKIPITAKITSLYPSIISKLLLNIVIINEDLLILSHIYIFTVMKTISFAIFLAAI